MGSQVARWVSTGQVSQSRDGQLSETPPLLNLSGYLWDAATQAPNAATDSDWTCVRRLSPVFPRRVNKPARAAEHFPGP